MDCEKLDEMAIDFVYDELEGRAAEEAERHLLGCTRCAALVERLRQGQKAGAALSLETPSSLLEARILEAASIAKQPEPWTRRAARVISIAGNYAMRPQVAMAAVLMVMVGMSVVMLRKGSAPRQAGIQEEGSPVATVARPSEDPDPANGKLAEAEHAEPRKKESAAPNFSIAPPAGLEAPADLLTQGLEGKADESEQAKDKSKAKVDGDGYGGADDEATLKNEVEKKVADNKPTETQVQSEMGGKAKKPAPATAGDMPAASPPPPAATQGPGMVGGAAGATAAKGVASSGSLYDNALASYQGAKYADAAQQFDASAAAGLKPSSSLLYAGRSQRALGKLGEALKRFQRVLAEWPASSDVPYAALEGGECARDSGDTTSARALFEKAKTYAVTKKRAEAALAALSTPAPAKPPVLAPAPKKASPINTDL